MRSHMFVRCTTRALHTIFVTTFFVIGCSKPNDTPVAAATSAPRAGTQPQAEAAPISSPEVNRADAMLEDLKRREEAERKLTAQAAQRSSEIPVVIERAAPPVASSVAATPGS